MMISPQYLVLVLGLGLGQLQTTHAQLSGDLLELLAKKSKITEQDVGNPSRFLDSMEEGLASSFVMQRLCSEIESALDQAVAKAEARQISSVMDVEKSTTELESETSESPKKKQAVESLAKAREEEKRATTALEEARERRGNFLKVDGVINKIAGLSSDEEKKLLAAALEQVRNYLNNSSILSAKAAIPPPTDQPAPVILPDDDPVITQEFPLQSAEARTLNIFQNVTNNTGALKVPGVVDTLLSILFLKPKDAEKDLSRAPSIPNIFAHQTKNAVVVLDKASHMPFYEETIRRLDRERPLIEISVAIIDINADASLSLGTDLLGGVNGTVSEGTGAIRVGSFSPFPVNKGTAAEVGDLNPLIDTLGSVGGSLPTDPLSPGLVEGRPFSVAGLIANSTGRLAARIRVLENEGKARILTRPSILTLANAEATFSDDRHLFIPVSGVNSANLYEVPVITQIKVVPRQVSIARDGSRQIQLVVMIDDSSDISADSPLANTPTVQASSVSSQAIVSEQGTLMVAGRYRHGESLTDARAPLLGRIPIVGTLFKQKAVIKNRAQRFYLISPRIVTPQNVRRNEQGETIWNYDQNAQATADGLALSALIPPLDQPEINTKALRKKEKEDQAVEKKRKKSKLPASVQPERHLPKDKK